MNIIIPAGSALTILICCLGCFFIRRRNREIRPHDIRELEAKIQHHAEEGTLDGTAEISDARTFTFSEDGIERYKRMVQADKSSTVDDELRGAMESLEDFEEVSLHEDDGDDYEKKSTANNTLSSGLNQLAQGAFRAVSAGLSNSKIPPIAETISSDSDVYVTNNEDKNKEDTFEESDNDYESVDDDTRDVEHDSHPEKVTPSSKIEESTNLVAIADHSEQEIASEEGEKEVIDLSTYDQKETYAEPDGLVFHDNDSTAMASHSKPVTEPEPKLVKAALTESSLSIPDDVNREDKETQEPAESTEINDSPQEVKSTMESTNEVYETQTLEEAGEMNSADTTQDYNKPEWMTKTLRSSPPSQSAPTPKTNEENVPEWMRKYKQMKFQKVDE